MESGPPTLKKSIAASVVWGLGALLSLWLISPHLWPPDSYGGVDFDQFFTWQLAVNTALQEGEILHWMPHLCGGIMGLANPQSGGLSPFNVLGLFLNPTHQFKIELLLHVLLSTIGFLMLARALRLPEPAALFGCVVWAGNGFVAFRMLHGQTTFFALWLVPILVALLIEEIYQSDARRAGLRTGTPSPYRWILGSTIVSLMILEDSVLVLMFAAFFLGGMALVASIRARDAGPIYLLLLWGSCSAALCAVRLWPMMELLQTTPRIVDDHDFLTFRMAYDALFHLDQHDLYLNFRRVFPHSVWGAYGAFSGVMPWLLGAYGAVRSRGPWRLPLFLVMIFGLVLMFGNFAGFAPWTLLRGIPPFHMVRAPYRFVILILIGLAMLSMVGGNALFRDLQSYLTNRIGIARARAAAAVAVAVLLLVTAGMLKFALAPLLNDMIVPRPVVPTSIEDRDDQFVHGIGNPRDMLPLVAKNKGILNCYRSMPFDLIVDPSAPPAYLLDTHQEVELFVGVNELRLKVELAEPGVVLVNQRFHQGWVVTSGTVEQLGPVGPGLIGLRLPVGEQVVVLSFASGSFIKGLFLTSFSLVCALVAMLMWIRRRRFSRRLADLPMNSKISAE